MREAHTSIAQCVFYVFMSNAPFSSQVCVFCVENGNVPNWEPVTLSKGTPVTRRLLRFAWPTAPSPPRNDGSLNYKLHTQTGCHRTCHCEQAV
jgi:hypothetical protein